MLRTLFVIAQIQLSSKRIGSGSAWSLGDYVHCLRAARRRTWISYSERNCGASALLVTASFVLIKLDGILARLVHASQGSKTVGRSRFLSAEHVTSVLPKVAVVHCSGHYTDMCAITRVELAAIHMASRIGLSAVTACPAEV